MSSQYLKSLAARSRAAPQAAKSGVERRARPGGLARLRVAKLEVRGADALAKEPRRALKPLGGLWIGGDDAGHGAERKRNERVAEKEALHFREGQNAGERA